MAHLGRTVFATATLVAALLGGTSHAAPLSRDEARQLAEAVCGASLADAAAEEQTIHGERLVTFRTAGLTGTTCSVWLERARVYAWNRGMDGRSMPATPALTHDEAFVEAKRTYARASGLNPDDLTWSQSPADWATSAQSLRTEVLGSGEFLAPDGERTRADVRAVTYRDGTVASYSQLFDRVYPVPANAISREQAIAIAARAAKVASPEVSPETKLAQFRGTFTWFVHLRDRSRPTSESVPGGENRYLCQIDAVTGAVVSCGAAEVALPWAAAPASAAPTAEETRDPKAPMASAAPPTEFPWLPAGGAAAAVIVLAAAVLVVRRRAHP